MVGGNYGTILFEQDGELKRVYASHHYLTQFSPRKKGFTYKAFKLNKPIIPIFRDVQNAHPELSKLAVKSDIMIPLSYQNKAYGVLTILSKKPNYFNKEHLAILKLYGPLATLAIKNTQYLEETKQALDTRDLFISMASHELKTPLTTVYAYTQLIQKKIDKGEELKHSWVATLLLEIKRLTELVNELLQVNQIQTGKLQFNMHKMNLSDVSKKAIKNFEFANSKRKIKFENNISQASIHGDTNKIQQLIINLLNNAAKHSPIDQAIVVTLTDKTRFITLSVKDKGIGIPKKDIPHIFDRFYKAKNNKQEGMGLGLYLVKKIIDAHNATISVKSEINKGTEFIITFPK